MPDCDSNSNHCNQSYHHSQLKSSSSSADGGLVPSSNSAQDKLGLAAAVSSSGSQSFADNSCGCSSSVGGRGCGGAAVEQGVLGDSSVCALLPLSLKQSSSNQSSDSHLNNNLGSGKLCNFFKKMFTCRVLILLLLVKCLILSFVIPAHLIPTTSSEYPAPPDYSDSNGNSNGGDSHQSTGDEDGFDNHIMLDDQPLSLTFKTEIMNLVEPFDIPSQTVTTPTESDSNGGVEESAPPTTSSSADDNADDGDGNGGGGDETDGNGESGTTNGGEPSDGDSDADGEADGKEDESESQVEEAAEPSEASESEAGKDSSKEGGNGDSCSSSNENGNGNGNSEPNMAAVLEKIENLMTAVKNIDLSIDKMETLVQTTMIDERVYKCMSAITNGNQTQALKYWKQILRYLSTPQKQAAILNQLIRDSYGGSEEHILSVIQFIDQTTQYYGYSTLFKELPKFNHLYRNTAIFTLGHYVKKSCGRDSALYKSLPSAVQNVFADFFTLQNKHNKGYLYYAKRCVAKHYFHCLDVLTKRIDPYVLDGLADDSEEKKRYHWKLNATDGSVAKFFILNHDKYWTYRLQDLNNSPRFKMEEAGSNAEIELAHFQLKLHTDDELMIQVRDSDDYLEEEDFKSDKAEVRLHSFHQADGIPDSPRMFWLANSVVSSNADDGVDEPDSCNIELASVTSSNGNGNGNSK